MFLFKKILCVGWGNCNCYLKVNSTLQSFHVKDLKTLLLVGISIKNNILYDALIIYTLWYILLYIKAFLIFEGLKAFQVCIHWYIVEEDIGTLKIQIQKREIEKKTEREKERERERERERENLPN